MTILKLIYCNYYGWLIVYDVYGKKVEELSGKITLDKYNEIEKRYCKDITIFQGLDNYRCFACTLKELC